MTCGEVRGLVKLVSGEVSSNEDENQSCFLEPPGRTDADGHSIFSKPSLTSLQMLAALSKSLATPRRPNSFTHLVNRSRRRGRVSSLTSRIVEAAPSTAPAAVVAPPRSSR